MKYSFPVSVTLLINERPLRHAKTFARAATLLDGPRQSGHLARVADKFPRSSPKVAVEPVALSRD